MKVEEIIPYYAGICVISMFSGVRYDAGIIVLRLFDFVTFIGLIIILLVVIERGYIVRVRKGIAYYSFATLYLYRSLYGFADTNFIVGFKELVQGIEFIILIHIIFNGTRREEQKRQFFWILLLGLGFISVTTALFHVIKGQYTGYKYLVGGQKYTFGMFALMSTVLYLKEGKGVYIKATVLIAILFLILSGERKGWLAFLISVSVLYLLKVYKYVEKRLINIVTLRILTVSVLAVASGLLAYNYSYTYKKLKSITSIYNKIYKSEFEYIDEGIGGQDIARFNGLVFGKKVLQQRPIFGIGTEKIEKYKKSLKRSGVSIAPGHGEYQRYAVENGLVGFFLYLSIWVSCIYDSFKISVKNKSNNKVFTDFVFGLSLYSAVVNLFMAGGAINLVFISLTVGLILSLKYPSE